MPLFLLEDLLKKIVKKQIYRNTNTSLENISSHFQSPELIAQKLPVFFSSSPPPADELLCPRESLRKSFFFSANFHALNQLISMPK